MKYGVNTLAWTTRVDERLAPLFDKIKRWGFDGVELFLSPGEPANITSVKRMLDAEGLERTTCSVLPRDANLVSHDAQVRARGMEFLKKCVDRTAELGAQLICGPLYAGLGSAGCLRGPSPGRLEYRFGVRGLQRRGETRSQPSALARASPH